MRERVPPLQNSNKMANRRPRRQFCVRVFEFWRGGTRVDSFWALSLAPAPSCICLLLLALLAFACCCLLLLAFACWLACLLAFDSAADCYCLCFAFAVA